MSSLAESGLDFMFWIEETSIDPKVLHRRRHNYRKNLRKQIGELIYCPYCHKKMRKQFTEQITCGKWKCDEKMKPYIELI